mmetsp:Transcript_64000/g.171433  ORF Transcript_64000/g.171433 Transcript_64000/m.171433 type:complete len:180 (+) Transcript_64000:3-542(+)
MVKVLVFLMEGFEEIETVSPIDILRRAGLDVVVASISDSVSVKGRSNIVMNADVLLSSIDPTTIFDCVVVPGGPGTKLLREHSTVLAMVKGHVEASKKVACICAAPTVLHAAGVLPSRYTAHQSVIETIPNILPDSVVIDGNIITSRGAGTAIEFGLKIVQELVGSENAQKIAAAIHFQ